MVRKEDLITRAHQGIDDIRPEYLVEPQESLDKTTHIPLGRASERVQQIVAAIGKLAGKKVAFEKERTRIDREDVRYECLLNEIDDLSSLINTTVAILAGQLLTDFPTTLNKEKISNISFFKGWKVGVKI